MIKWNHAHIWSNHQIKSSNQIVWTPLVRGQPAPAFLPPCRPGFSGWALIWPPGLSRWDVRRLKGTWQQELALYQPFSNAMSSKVFADECLMPSSPAPPSDTGHFLWLRIQMFEAPFVARWPARQGWTIAQTHSTAVPLGIESNPFFILLKQTSL